MNVVVFTLFQVIPNPHNLNIVTIDQLSLINSCKIFAHPISFCVANIQVVPSNPQVNYVAFYPILSIAIEKGPLLSLLYSLDLVPIVDLDIHSMGEFESNLLSISPNECPNKLFL